MNCYILVDHLNAVAFDLISEADARDYINIQAGTDFHLPSTDQLEGDHHVGNGEYITVIFIDNVSADKYTLSEGSYSELATFIQYEEGLDGFDDKDYNDIEYADYDDAQEE